MTIIYLLLFVFSLFIYKTIYRTVYVPGTIMAVVWCVLPIISDRGLYGLKVTSMSGAIVIVISYISYLVGTLVSSSVFQVTKTGYRVNIQNIEREEYVNYRFLIIGNIFGIFILSKRLLNSIAIIQSMGFAYLRYVSNTEFGSTIEILIYAYFAIPFAYVSLIICFFNFATKKKINKPTLILSSVLIIINAIVWAERASLVRIALYAFFAMFFCITKERSKKQMLFFCALGVLFIVAISFLTAKRMEGFSLAQSIAIYFGGPFYVLGYIIDNPDIYKLNIGNYMWGAGAFGFIFNTFYYAIAVFLGIDYAGSDYIIGNLTQNTYVWATTEMRMNASYTAAFVFLKDFGYIGLFLGFFFLGAISHYILVKYVKHPNLKNGAIYIAMLYILFKTVSRYELIGTEYFMLFCILSFSLWKPKLSIIVGGNKKIYKRKE